MAYTLQQIVWGKIVGYPYWPAVIIDSMNIEAERPSNKNNSKQFFAVKFLADYTKAWVEKSFICPYEENREKFRHGSRSQLFLRALEEAEQHIIRQKDDPDYRIDTDLNKRPKRSNEENSPVKMKKIKVKPVRNSFNSDLDDGLIVGVIGTGIIGGEIVKNLIKSGQKVNIWNRTFSKCSRLEKELEEFDKLTSLLSARAVLIKCNVIFICLSDEEATLNIIDNDFEAVSENENLIKNKGIIVMSSINPTTSIVISKKVQQKGGAYLELAIQGSQREAATGELILLTAGDENLFHSCQDYFEAIASSSYYLGDVGYALKIGLILQMIKGVNLAALGEGISLAEHFGIPPEMFVTIFNDTSIASDFLNKKAASILEQEFSAVQQPLADMQKNLKIILEIADSVDHAMALANTANEMYKYCKKLQYGSHDVCAVFLKNKRL